MNSTTKSDFPKQETSTAMLFKWIVCNVREEMRDSFAIAQKKWNELAKVPDFKGQLGGWDLKSKDNACVLGIWQDKEAYELFMSQYHDLIFINNQQGKTYETIDVSLLRPVFNMPGMYNDMTDCLETAKVIRVADCLLRPEREEHFTCMQETIWTPAMSQAPGMLAGSFNKVTGSSSRYIVITLWKDLEAHENYVRSTVPALRSRAAVSQDVEHITGRLIGIVADWLVKPSCCSSI